MQTKHIPKVGMTVHMGDGLVCLVVSTYAGPTWANEPDWRLACDRFGRYRPNGTWRGRDHGMRLTCLTCIAEESHVQDD
jgi:hypothetical protein